jgi:uncharacterized protein YqeY
MPLGNGLNFIKTLINKTMLKERINADFMSAFKNKETEKKNFLGVVKGEIQNEEGRSGVATNDVVVSILRKMEKSLTQTRTPEALKELEYIKPYLPVQMGPEKIRIIISAYKDSGITNPGKMMGEFNKTFKGMADNKVVSEIVKEVLAGQ